jgi:RNA polymerase sigma-B factor
MYVEAPAMPTATVRSRNDDEVAPVLPGDDAGVERVEHWLQAFAVSRDLALREQIVLAYLGLADRLADRHRSSRGTTREDLIQTARAALVAAVDRYDPGRERGFVPFAVACVVGELKRYLRDATWRLHVPRLLKERSLVLCKAVDELAQRLGRSPTLAELAAHLEVRRRWRHWRWRAHGLTARWTRRSTRPRAARWAT